MAGYGFLAIWTEIDEEYFIDYRNWLTREHVAQRIFAPGFLAARVHVRHDDEHAHFILYATESRSVLQSQSYLNVLNNPTPWTQRMMPLLRKFDRGAGEQLLKIGDGTGGWIVVSRLAAALDRGERERVSNVLKQALDVEGVATARLFSVDQESTSIETAEMKMRSGSEGKFQFLLVIEACSDAAAVAAEALVHRFVRPLLGPMVSYDVARYRQVYALHAFEGATQSGPVRT